MPGHPLRRTAVLSSCLALAVLVAAAPAGHADEGPIDRVHVGLNNLTLDDPLDGLVTVTLFPGWSVDEGSLPPGALYEPAQKRVVLPVRSFDPRDVPAHTFGVVSPAGAREVLTFESPGAGGPAADPPVTTRVAGADRYETAVALARETATAPAVVVIASGVQGRMVDSVSAAPLAASLEAPLLTTTPGALPPSVRDWVATTPSLGEAVVVGGEATVSEAVLDELRGLGLAVRRVAGADRYSTSALVAREPSLAGARYALVTSGGDVLADPVSASGIAGGLRAPVVVVPRDPGALADVTRAAVAGKEVVVVGGEAAVPGPVASALGAARRIAGGDRYATSLRVASWGVGMSAASDEFVVTSGADARLADALAAGSAGRPSLLVPEQGWGSDVQRLLAGLRTSSVLVVGGGTAER